MKKLSIMLGISALAFLLTATPVLASTSVDVTSANETTGAESKNENETEIKNYGDVTVNNNGDVDNKAKAKVNTGNNDQEKNTTGGDLTSGDVDATTEWESAVNNGWGLCGCPFGDQSYDVTVDFLNDTTGYKSVNENELEIKNYSDTTINNYADIFNKLWLDANTGYNDQNMNTTAGDLETGDVMVASMISNWANVSDDSFAAASGSGWNVDVTAENHKTGAESKNKNEVEIKNSGDTTINNNADVDNIVKVKANTGYNNQNMNTTAGDLKTGNVEVVADMTTVANSGACCPTHGENSLTANLTNDTTGYDSTNENEVEIKNSGDTTINNTADVNNKVEVEANTGGNDQNMNTEGGDVETGSVSIDFSSSTTVNSTN